MEKNINICRAIAHLPEHLITPEIAAAAIEEGEIELLDHLPHKYLTEDDILAIIENKEGSYSWQSFSLSNIPVELRTQKICDFAVTKKTHNFAHVPQEYRSEAMLKKMVNNISSGIRYLHQFPENLWNSDLAYAGVNSAYATQHQTHHRGRSSYTTSTDILRVQAYLTFVPQAVKTRLFYSELLSKTNLSTEKAALLIPRKYKDRSYYLQMAVRNFGLIPQQEYDQELFMTALSEGSRTSIDTLFDKNIQPHLFNVMDDALADRVVTLGADRFKKLPEAFRTSKRLILAINAYTGNYCYNLVDDASKHLFTKAVCQAFVRKDKESPALPQKIWTADFVEYCMKYGKSYHWFKQMPPHFQTREMVHSVLNKCSSNLRYVRPELISLEQAQKLYRHSENAQKHIPERFYEDFTQETGLPVQFFGGETTFLNLREDKKSYTYCRLGRHYLGIYQTCGYNSSTYLILTRRTPHAIQPQVMFNRTVSTFHTTWLEKMIADYDPSFIKPTISKALKPYQTNGYYALKKVGAEYGTDIYANLLLEEQIFFTALIENEVVINNSLDKLKKELKEFQTESINFGTPAPSVEAV